MMMGVAMGAVLSGQAKAVLCFRSLNGRSESRLGAGTSRMTSEVVGGFGTYDEFFLPYGLQTAGQTFALMARRHMLEYGTTPEQLARSPWSAGRTPTAPRTRRWSTGRWASTTT
jgi:acetyl-CoA acetyltransferase